MKTPYLHEDPLAFHETDVENDFTGNRNFPSLKRMPTSFTESPKVPLIVKVILGMLSFYAWYDTVYDLRSYASSTKVHLVE